MRSLDSLRPAWSGRLRHGSPPSVPSNDTLPNKNHQSVPLSFKPSNNIVSNVKQIKDPHDNQIKKIKITNPPAFFTQKTFEKIVGTNSNKKSIQLINLTDPFVNVDETLKTSKELNSNNPFANDVNENQCDPFDTSPMQTALSGSFSNPTHNPLRKNYSSLNKELSSRSAHSKVNTIIYFFLHIYFLLLTTLFSADFNYFNIL